MAANFPFLRAGRAMHLGSLVAVAAWVFLAAGTVQADPPLPPKPDKYFNDYANVVPADVGQRLNATLEQFERDTTNQVLVALFPKLPEGTYLEDYTVKTAQFWGTGQKKQQNGIILFAFIQDRKMRIEVGYGLEGVVPDLVAASIIREVIKPQFKLGNYGAGVEQGVDAIIKATRNEYKGTGQTVADGAQGAPISGRKIGFIFLVVVIFLIWCQMGDTMIQRGGRSFFWGLLDILRMILIALITNNGSSGSSSSGGGFSSGGGYSGGGGSFGGGGASGDW